MLLRAFRSASGAVFFHPLQPVPKTAILVPGFRETRSVRVFPGGWSDACRRFAPAAVVATFPQLRELSTCGVRFTHTLVVLSWSFDKTLTPAERDFLWSAFGAPIFEQVLAPDNSLLAYECDAHDGLHLLDPNQPTLTLVQSCSCGSPLPRRVNTTTACVIV